VGFSRLGSNSIAYEALPYAWGDPEVTTTIHVNGQSLRVTIGLEAFLLRRQATHRPLMPIRIDAICVYLDRPRMRVVPLFSEGLGFREPEMALTTLPLLLPFIHISLFGLLRAGSGSSTIRSPVVILSRSPDETWGNVV
jgi:Heterokaryon incompatibility protein (HET)